MGLRVNPQELGAMPAVHVLQLRNLAWLQNPRVTPIIPGETWIEKKLAALDSE